MQTPGLRIMETFPTLQGEGVHSGKYAWFIRLGGCDVGCVWCDVKESWPLDTHQLVAVEALVQDAVASRAPMVVVTGGEPLMQPLDKLTARLRQAGLATHLETSGAYPLSGEWDWVCLSPKKFKPCLPELYAHASELKVVIYHPSDLEWARTHADLCPSTTVLTLQPEWSKLPKVMPDIFAFIRQYPEWRVSLQGHKYANLP